MTQGFPDAMTAMQNDQGLVLPNGTTTTHLSDRRTVRGNARVGAGFSLVELMIVLAIALVVSAFAIPTLTTTMDGVRLRGSTGSATNIAQRCRMQAAKRNLYQRLHFSTCGNRVVLFVTDGTDAAACPAAAGNSLSSQIWLGPEFSIPGVPAGAGAPPQLTSAQMWGTATAPNVNIDPYFNARGLPCLKVGAVCNSTTGFVYYYRYRSGARIRWAANSISPAGRIESWIWNGNAWGN
jgi:prepilin-type N-terminal cleavage/methylation domain-containing protein